MGGPAPKATFAKNDIETTIYLIAAALCGKHIAAMTPVELTIAGQLVDDGFGRWDMVDNFRLPIKN